MKLKKIISGGQTGVDRAALDFALEKKFDCGGWCPKGRQAEDGRIPGKYPLKETSTNIYAQRTERNVIEADGTLILSEGEPTGGTAFTIETAIKREKPYFIIDLSKRIPQKKARTWLERNKIKTVNVAGPRESTSPGIYERSLIILELILRQ